MLTEEQKEIVLRAAYDTAVAHNCPQAHLSLEEYFDDEMKKFLFDVFGNFLAALPKPEPVARVMYLDGPTTTHNLINCDLPQGTLLYTHAPDSTAEIAALDTEIAFLKCEAKKRREDRAARIKELEAEVARLTTLSVTNIMIDVVPGDGSGHEVFAKSIDDVEQLISRLGEKAEDFDLETIPLRNENVALKEKLLMAREAIDKAARSTQLVALAIIGEE